MNLGRMTKRLVPIVLAVLFLAAGLACLNYTKPMGLQEHQEWATLNARPAPSDTVFWGGVGSAALGAFVLGWAIGRR